MFLELLKKECAQYLKSIIYYVFLFFLVLDFISQMGTFKVMNKPEPGQKDYGMVRTENKDIIMQTALDCLLREYEVNEYITYPIGFYKRVILNDKEQGQVKEILLDITGLTKQELDETYEEYDKEVNEFYEKLDEENRMAMDSEIPPVGITVRENLDYQEFCRKMEELDNLLGGGSNYNKASLKHAEEPATYEQVLAEYESLIKNDRITNAYARLFCDYLGIILAILPVFLAITRALRDRKAQAEQVIFMAQANSAQVVLSRYLAAIVMTVIPVFLCSCSTLMQAAYYAKSINVEYDAFAFVKHIGFWLLPTIMVSLSVGFFLTELTDSAIAILVQSAWWFVNVFLGAEELVGTVGWNLVPRFNTVGSYSLYSQIEGQLVKNRSMYTAFAVLLILLTVFIYSKKRKGEFVSVGTVLRNRKSKLEA